MQSHVGILTASGRYQDAVELFSTRFEKALEDVRGVGPNSDRGQIVISAAVRLVEELVGRLQVELNSERSQLLAELASANARVESLEAQLHDALRMLMDAQRSRTPGVIRSGLLALAGFLAGVGTGVAEGVGGAVFEQLVDGASVPAAVDYSICFYALDDVLDTGGVYASTRTPADDSLSGPDDRSSEDADDPADEVDEIDQDPWLAVPPELGPEYVVWKEAGFHPLEALDWSAFGFGPQESLRWLAYGLTPSEARSWIDRSLDGSMREPIEPGDAIIFAEYEISPDEAMSWLENGFEPLEAVNWRSYEFQPDEAHDWKEEGFDAEDADDWRSQQLTPDNARLELNDG